MRKPRIDIQSIRRGEIVEAAVAVIAAQGIQKLSLSEIETEAGMSRGQLTYYFKTKEDILLAVFDRVVQLAYQRIGMPEGHECAGGPAEATAWPWIEHLLEKLLADPPVNPEFGCLQYTFLSQIGHRPDFRIRLGKLYEEWRSGMAHGLAADLAGSGQPPGVSPRTLASLVQAILHGIGVQLSADPKAFDRDEMLQLCLDVLSTYLGTQLRGRRKRAPAARKTTTANGSSLGRRPRQTRRPQSVNHE
jgi:AcrR family transcriptional regulator